VSELRDRPRVAAAMAILVAMFVGLGVLFGLAAAGGDNGPSRAGLVRAERTAAAATRELRELRQETGPLRARVGELEQDRAALRRRARRAETSATLYARGSASSSRTAPHCVGARGAPRPPPSAGSDEPAAPSAVRDVPGPERAAGLLSPLDPPASTRYPRPGPAGGPGPGRGDRAGHRAAQADHGR
jgi:cell division protein FtsB